MTKEEFKALIEPVLAIASAHAVGAELEGALNREVPADGPLFRDIEAACHQAIEAGWMCAEGDGNRRFGRVIEPSVESRDLSIDVVDLTDIRAPHHVHPNGEVLMIMPQDEGATFDRRGKGWLVYGPGTGHRPTVEGGRALVLYLLPDGQIEWTAN